MLELKPMIHKFRMKDNYYCLDVNSGIIHVIDELIDRVLDIYDGTNRDAVHAALDAKEDAVELDEIMDELDELIKAEQLFAPMSKEFKLVVGEKPIVKALCLNIAHDCNLACKYCFASQGDYGGVKREFHNAMRPVAGSGAESYKYIAKNLVNAVKQRHGLEYYVRGTYTHKNLDFTKDVMAMSDLGFEHLSMEPVVGEEGDYVLREEDWPALEKEYEKLADIYLQRQLEGWGEKFNFFHFRMDLYRGPCMAKRLRGCGAGHEYMAIVPNGDIYPCHQFVGKDGYVLGNVYDGLQNTEIPKDFRNTHVFSKPICAECWAKFFCSGGCHANNITLGGDLETPYEFGCRLQKKRIECAIMIQAELEQAGIDGSIPVALG
ncbi:MAG: SPASM domain-containing protein [Veillonella sp.]|nr:SPASM domain-containing protein [Veillonella sp.]